MLLPIEPLAHTSSVFQNQHLENEKNCGGGGAVCVQNMCISDVKS